jgi:hypothetical protein
MISSDGRIIFDFFGNRAIFLRAFSIAVGVKSRKAGEGKSKKVKGKRETVGMYCPRGADKGDHE